MSRSKKKLFIIAETVRTLSSDQLAVANGGALTLTLPQTTSQKWCPPSFTRACDLK